MTSRPAVLVTDGEERAALAVVRSLGRAGYPVYVTARTTRSLAGASRYARAVDVVADPLASPRRFADDVAAVVRRRGIGALIPITDAALVALGPERERFAGVLFPWPDPDVVARVADKAAVTEVAREVGIGTPAQRLVRSVDEASAAAAELRFPLVAKPTRSVREQGGRLAKLTVSHVSDRPSLAARLAQLGSAAFPVLLQERIVGPGVGVSLLMWEGRVVARFAHRRLRERPPSGGVSVYAESIAADEALVERSVALLRRLGWQGVAMVEYKIDAASGTPHLMEINGRFWGSLQLAVDAGVDFPTLLLDAAQGSIPPTPAYRVGRRFRWWWGDVDHLLVRLARSAERLALPPGAPGRWRVVREFVAAGLPQRDSDVLRLDDPRPFVVETRDWLHARVLGGAAARHAAQSDAPPDRVSSSAASSPV